ncbi:MAG TPA: hypothetical protein VGG19_12230 [Tepidisphaeraceae bacterium]|jgi:hypothetical protein
MSRLKTRRRRGESRALWRVWRDDGPIGYLVTDSPQGLQPIAFIKGNREGQLSLAALIQALPGAACRAMDLRKVSFDKLPAIIGGSIRYLSRKSDHTDIRAFTDGSILFPIDRSGRKLESGTFPAAMILMKSAGASEDGYLRFTRGNVPGFVGEKKNGTLKLLNPASPQSKGRNRKAAKRR